MQHDANVWIMRPFNGLFLGVYAVLIILLIITSRLLRGKSFETRRNVLTGMCVFSMIGFFVYKYSLSLDKEYMVIYENFGGFNWWRELPLQLCNINMMLIPVSVFKKNRNLMASVFLSEPLALSWLQLSRPMDLRDIQYYCQECLDSMGRIVFL